MSFNKFHISTILSAFLIGCGVPIQAKEGGKLVFDPTDGKQATLTMPSGENIAYTAYENIIYVTNIEDSVYQTSHQSKSYRLGNLRRFLGGLKKSYLDF